MILTATIRSSDLLLQDISTVEMASDWLIVNLGMATQDDRTVKIVSDWLRGNLLLSNYS